MSCDRESVTSCQDLLAMSRTRRYSYWVHQKILALCVSAFSRWAGPEGKSNQGETDCGDDLLSLARAGGCIVTRRVGGTKNCGETPSRNRGGGQGNLGMLGRMGRMACQNFRVSRYAQRVSH